MSSDVVTFEIEGHVGLVTLNRPSVHNAVNEAVMERLENILDQVEQESDLSALILTGAGNETFSAGGDLKYFATLQTREAAIEMSKRMQAILNRLWKGDRVVIAAVNGQALGGGCEILTACHFRIAASTAKFAFRQAANGLTTGWGGGTRLFRLLGRARALDLLLTSREFDSEAALRIGFIDRTVSGDVLLSEAQELARAIGANSGQSVQAFLELARTVDEEDPRAIDRETELFGDCWVSEEFRQALRRFAERRNDNRG